MAMKSDVGGRTGGQPRAVPGATVFRWRQRPDEGPGHDGGLGLRNGLPGASREAGLRLEAEQSESS